MNRIDVAVVSAAVGDGAVDIADNVATVYATG